MAGKYVYPYKHFSDVPSTGTIMILVGSLRQRLCPDLKLSELEGVFVCSEDLSRGSANYKGDPLCRRDEMPLFEERYKGEFIPLNKKD